MRLTITTLIFCFLLCNILQSQVGVNIDGDISAANSRAYIGTFDNRETSYTGSPLLWEEWMYTSILLEGNKKYSDKEYHLNYNALEKIFYVRIGNSVYDLLLTKVKSLKMMTDIDEFTEYRLLRDENLELDLYEVLYTDENHELVKRTDVMISKAHYNAALDAGDIRPNLKRSESLFILKDGQLYKLPKSRKKLVNKYESTKEIKDIVAFFNKNRVDLKNEDEIYSALIDFNKNK